MKHIKDYIATDINEAMTVGAALQQGVNGLKSIGDYIKNAFKAIKNWLKGEKVTVKDAKQSMKENDESKLSKELADAVSEVLKKSSLPRSDKKKKDDDEADAYDKLKALLLIMATNIQNEVINNSKRYEITKEEISTVGSEETDTYKSILNLGVAAIQKYGDKGKNIFCSAEIAKIIHVYLIYKIADKQGVDKDKRMEIYRSQGTFN